MTGPDRSVDVEIRKRFIAIISGGHGEAIQIRCSSRLYVPRLTVMVDSIGEQAPWHCRESISISNVFEDECRRNAQHLGCYPVLNHPQMTDEKIGICQKLSRG